MQTAAYHRLYALRERHGPREFGKICQKLLALAFRAAGCRHVVERGVQGVDIDAAWAEEKHAVEVKTTTERRVLLGVKDVLGLASRGADGYRPLLAVLRLTTLSDWLFADAARLTAGYCDIELLRPRRQAALEQRLRPHFECMLERHFAGALQNAQTYLDGMLQEQGVQGADRG